jgi:arabinofuranosyltransferase
LAGNGPVFNAGERVESNTSTAWTYLVYLGSLISGPLRLEYVALALALALSVAGVVMVMLGTARLWGPRLRGRRALILPAGVLVYIAVPPARDFATSGLENGLVTAWLGLLWWMMVRWSQQPGSSQGKQSTTAGLTALAFLAGLSVLVRPELALIGGLALVMMLIAESGWARRAAIVVAGGLLPVGYQIFRMGYYGLLVPQTAIAKDASGSKWGQGFVYLHNFTGPYALWIPAVLLVALALLLRAEWGGPGGAPRSAPVAHHRVRSPRAVVVFMLVSGLVQGLYWIRQGGDFMHGRVLLTPLFCLLAPIAVLPFAVPDGPPARGGGRGAVAGPGRLGVVGGQLTRDGARRHPGHLHRNRRRAPVLLPGDRSRPPADRRRLPRLPEDAGGPGRHRKHPRRGAAAAVGQLRRLGRRPAEAADRPAATGCDR